MNDENPESAVLSHQEIYSGKIVSLYVDTIRQPSGRETIREVVLHPGGVAAIPVSRRRPSVVDPPIPISHRKIFFEIPAGKLDSGQSPLETIAREIEEETGYSAGVLSHECTFYTTPGISDESIHLFLARDLTLKVQRLEEGEHITVEAYSLEECLEKIQTGEINDGKTILGILWYHHTNQVVKPNPLPADNNKEE